MTFNVFKAEIKKLYPGSDGERLYTWTDLREVVKKGLERSPRDREEFAKYQQDFQRIADFLKDKGKISDQERNKLFMKGIHSDFCFRVGKCAFCSESGHYLRECPKVLEYVRAGKCMQNEQGRIVIPNGWYIPWAITRNNFLDRLDKWHAANPGNIKQRDQPPPITKEVFDGVHLPPKPPLAIKRKVGFVPEVDGPAGRLPQIPLVKDAAPPNGPRPYVAKFRAPIEEMVKPADLVKRALSSKFKITGEEFFAIYPEGRKFAKDLLTSKKVPVVEVAYSETSPGQPPEPQYILCYEEENDERRDEHLTSSKIDVLRVIDPLINGEHQIEAILDQGSEIIAMNRDVWLKLGVGLDPQKVLHMQSANSQSNSTARVISDLKFTIEGVDLLLQVHVVQGAPFDLLMGRPFFRFTSCQTVDNMDGSQEITITCPNTGKRVTVPTRKKTPKSRNPFKTTNGAAVGFQGAGPRN
ncbi:hypothetical protein B0H17DRAFT_951897 [Mycena rosella]|uniref:CCHC-type domain-containing protein n=1 Tax=Mycena rosella TaxID=1033263 RepID=A0AAD7G4C4_MYCRO|nr:hypothetical protein B0H17DRAFT_951897 [Mycena rosella]